MKILAFVMPPKFYVSILTPLWIYALAVFVSLEPNIFEWYAAERAAFAAASLVFGFFVYLHFWRKEREDDYS